VEELVVLLDEEGQGSGALGKLAVHNRDTPLNLAFSCYVFNERGEFLLARRAWGKLTWPGEWTNSCCGHPRALQVGELARVGPDPLAWPVAPAPALRPAARL